MLTALGITRKCGTEQNIFTILLILNVAMVEVVILIVVGLNFMLLSYTLSVLILIAIMLSVAEQPKCNKPSKMSKINECHCHKTFYELLWSILDGEPY
jgi:hypothetical protein